MRFFSKSFNIWFDAYKLKIYHVNVKNKISLIDVLIHDKIHAIKPLNHRVICCQACRTLQKRPIENKCYNMYCVFYYYLEEFAVVESILNTAHFSTTVHGKLRSTDINGFDSSIVGEHWANSWTAWRVITNHEFLNGNSGLFSKSSADSSRNTISGISQVAVSLDDNTLHKCLADENIKIIYVIDLRLMVSLVLFSVVGMDTVSHISRDKETSLNCLFKWICLNIILLGRKKFVDSMEVLKDNVRICSLLTHWTDFFVVKE